MSSLLERIEANKKAQAVAPGQINPPESKDSKTTEQVSEEMNRVDVPPEPPKEAKSPKPTKAQAPKKDARPAEFVLYIGCRPDYSVPIVESFIDKARGVVAATVLEGKTYSDYRMIPYTGSAVFLAAFQQVFNAASSPLTDLFVANPSLPEVQLVLAWLVARATSVVRGC